jgi:uncharacterized protein Yka (UPF0111/DUF47 family)
MSGGGNNPLTKVVGRIFPKVPDFYSMLAEQSALAVTSADALVAYTETGDDAFAEQVRAIEHEGDTIKERNLRALDEAFSTPMDREDLYRAIQTIDHVMNYAKTTVREMQVLEVSADEPIREMSRILRDGVVALDAGYRVLATDPHAAEPAAASARKAERNIEKAYRRGLAQLFDVDVQLAQMEASDSPTGHLALARVLEILKKREVYRHISNAADRLARAGEVLRDVVVKLV